MSLWGRCWGCEIVLIFPFFLFLLCFCALEEALDFATRRGWRELFCID